MLDFAELKHSSISFFDLDKHETAVSRWSRARTRAAKVGKGLSKNGKAQKLALQHWLEAVSLDLFNGTPNLCFMTNFNFANMEKAFLCNRSTHDIVMDTTCISTMCNGCILRAKSPSSTGTCLDN